MCCCCWLGVCLAYQCKLLSTMVQLRIIMLFHSSLHKVATNMHIIKMMLVGSCCHLAAAAGATSTSCLHHGHQGCCFWMWWGNNNNNYYVCWEPLSALVNNQEQQQQPPQPTNQPCVVVVGCGVVCSSWPVLAPPNNIYDVGTMDHCSRLTFMAGNGIECESRRLQSSWSSSSSSINDHQSINHPII